jgi:hypothetical protein
VVHIQSLDERDIEANLRAEQDPRRVKQRIRPMLVFKRFDNAVVTIGQFQRGKLGGRKATMTLWNAALAA